MVEKKYLRVYFSEYKSVYGDLKVVSGRMILKEAPLSEDIKKLGVDGVNQIWREAKLSGAGMKRATTLVSAAEHSFGSKEAARIELKVLYVIAAYLRLYPKEWFDDQRLMGILMIAGIVLSWGSVAAMAYASRILNKGIGLAYFFVSDSNKVLAFATSLSVFLFFRNLKIGYSRYINKIAASTFGVLMIHANSDTMRRFLWEDACRNTGWYTSPYLVLHAVGCVLGVYVLCTVIDIVRIREIEKLVLARIN